MKTLQQKYDCDRCGNTYRKDELKRQRGMYLCSDCFDDIKEIKARDMKWLSPRDNSTTTTAVTSPTTFSITTSGVTVLANSTDYTREGSRRVYFMNVVGSPAAVDISANPQIVAGTDGAIVTLRGTSNTNTVKLEDGNGLSLTDDSPMILGEGDSITLIYSSADTLWREASRFKGGL